MQEDPGLSLKDKKLSRKRFRGVSRQVLPAFRKRIRWGVPRRLFVLHHPLPRAGLFPALQLGPDRAPPPPVGDMRPLPVFPAGRSRAPCPPNLTGGRAPALIPFPLLPHFLPRSCALPRDTCSRPASGHPFPRHRTTSFRRQKKWRRTPRRKRLLRDVGPRLSWLLNDERLLFRSLSKDNLGIGLLSHVKMRSIMGDEALNFRVRNGIGCTRFSMDTKEISKNI